MPISRAKHTCVRPPGSMSLSRRKRPVSSRTSSGPLLQCVTNARSKAPRSIMQMREAERESLVRAGIDAQPLIGALGKGRGARIDHDHARAALHGALHLCGAGEPGGGGIVAPQQHAVRRGEIRRADIGAVGEARGVVLVPVADLGGVDGVRAAVAAHQPLDPGDGILDVRAARRGGREGDLLGPMRPGDGAETRCDLVERRVPVDGLPSGIGGAFGIGPAQRRRQPVLVVDELGCGAALRAQLVAGRMAGEGLDAAEAAVLDHRRAAAARAALGAECGNAFYLRHKRPPVPLTSRE